MTTVSPDVARKTPEERKELLARSIQNQLSQGKRRIDTRGDYDAVVVKRKNFDIGIGVHIALSIVTIGLWLFVWLILAMADKEQRFMVTIDEYGNTGIAQLD